MNATGKTALFTILIAEGELPEIVTYADNIGVAGHFVFGIDD